MAADGTVNIDVILNAQQPTQTAKELDETLNNVGKNTGDKAEENLRNALGKSVNQAKYAHDEMEEAMKQPVEQKITADTDEADSRLSRFKEKVGLIPHDVKTKLIADAREQGIENFGQLLRKIPKEQRTELIAKAQRGEVVNYEELLRKVPARVVTEAKLNNKASLPLHELQQEATQTTHSFGRLKDMIAGTFVGGMAINGIHAIGNGLREAARAGMEYNVEQDRMKTVWTALTTETPKDGKVLVNYINDMAQHSIYAASTIDRMAQSFYHVHSSVKETKDWTNGFIRLGSTLHMTNDQLAEAGEQFAKIVAGGKANAEDMSVMINRFPMFGEALQKATGKSMKQLYQMSAQGKLTAKDFTEALDYLSNKYKGSTEEAMTSFTGMSMYIRQRWMVLWGEVTNTSFKANKKMSEDLRDLLSDQMISRYSKLLGDALGTIMNGAMKLLDYIGEHKNTIVDLTGNLIKLVAIMGNTVWHVFGDFLSIIAHMFGLVGKNGKAAVDPLELLDDVTKALVSHEGAVKAFTVALVAMFAVKRIMNFVMWMSRAREALLSFGLAQKAIDGMSFGAKPSPYLTAESAEKNAGQMIIPRLNSASGAMSVLRANKAVPILTAVGGVGTELLSNNNTGQKIGGSIGSVGGTALGALAGSFLGPGGTLVGSMAGEYIGKKIGEAAGNAANKEMAGHSIVAHTKVKIDTDASGQSRAIRPDLNQVARTVIKMDVDSKSIAQTKAKTDKLYSDMSKSLKKYYDDKEKRSQKDLQQLVKEGAITQQQANRKLKAERDADQKRIKQEQSTLNSMQKATNDHYKKLQNIESGQTKKLLDIERKYGKNSKQYNQERVREIQKENQRYTKILVRDQMKADRSINASVKKGASQQEKIYKDLIKRKGKLSQQDLKQTQRDADKQYRATVRPAQRARDEVIKSARDKYRETTKTAEREYKENHTISRKQYRDIVNDAKDQRDGTIREAKRQYDSVTKTASDQHRKVTSEINKQKEEVVNAANTQATSHGAAAGQEYTLVNANVQSGQKKTAGIMNGFHKSVNNILKALSASQSIPMIGYATGTGALTKDQLAMVGEEGFELAHTPRGYEILGANGPELRYLSAGTSILTHAQSKAAMVMNGGKLPGYAKGTGAKVEDFVKDGLDKADDALDAAMDLVGKGIDEIWNWIKQKFGVTNAINSLDVQWLDRERGKGATDMDGKAVSSLLKKFIDQFQDTMDSDSTSPAATGSHEHWMKQAGIPASWFSSINYIVTHESGWNPHATNPSSGAYGLPQALPASKLAAAGRDWRDNPITQLKWMKNYVSRYGGGPGAAAFWRSHHWYANGGWADMPGIFGEVPGQPELAINPARDSAEEHIAEAIEARAKVNPNGFAGNLSKLINTAKQSAQQLVPVFASGQRVQNARQVAEARSANIDGNINLTMNIDGKQLSRIIYPTMKAMRSHEVIINGAGGAIPVGNAQPLGGVYH